MTQSNKTLIMIKNYGEESGENQNRAENSTDTNEDEERNNLPVIKRSKQTTKKKKCAKASFLEEYITNKESVYKSWIIDERKRFSFL